jgi:hypothetical protein
LLTAGVGAASNAPQPTAANWNTCTAPVATA